MSFSLGNFSGGILLRSRHPSRAAENHPERRGRAQVFVLVSLASLALLYAVIAGYFSSFHAFWSGDSGARFAMIENGLRHGSLTSLTYDNAADPTGRLHPLQFYVMHGPKGFNVMYPPLFPWLCEQAFRLWGFGGLTLLPLAGGLGTLWVTSLTATRLGLWSARLLPLVMGLATPLIVYSVVFWDHTLLMLLTAGAGHCWLRALQSLATEKSQTEKSQTVEGRAAESKGSKHRVEGNSSLGFAAMSGALLGVGVWVHELFLLLFAAVFLACLPLLREAAPRRLVITLTSAFLLVLLLWAAGNQAMYGLWAGPHLMANVGHHKVSAVDHNAGAREALDPWQIGARAVFQIVGTPDPAAPQDPSGNQAGRGLGTALLLLLGGIAVAGQLRGAPALAPRAPRCSALCLLLVRCLPLTLYLPLALYLAAAVVAALLLRCWVPSSGLFQVTPLLAPALAASWRAKAHPVPTLQASPAATGKTANYPNTNDPNTNATNTNATNANDQNPEDQNVNDQNAPSDHKENQPMPALPSAPLPPASVRPAALTPASVSPASVFYAWMGRVCALFALLVFINPVLPGMDWGSRYLLTVLPFLVLLAAGVLERQYQGTPVGTRRAFLPILGAVIGISIASQGCGLAAVRNDLLYSRDLNQKAAAVATSALVTDIYWLGPELTASSLPQAQFLVRSEADRQLFLAAQRRAALSRPAPQRGKDAEKLSEERAFEKEVSEKEVSGGKSAEFTFMGTAAGLAALTRTASEEVSISKEPAVSQEATASQAPATFPTWSAFRPVAAWNDAGLQFAHFVLAPSAPPSARLRQRAGDLPPATAAKDKHVLALYYPWYGTPARSGQWLHQEPDKQEPKKMADHAHFPALGAYDSTDPAVIERHLGEAQAAGIDTLVCSWWGRTDRTDVAIHLLLRRAAAHSLKICVLWERPGADAAPRADAPKAGDQVTPKDKVTPNGSRAGSAATTASSGLKAASPAPTPPQPATTPLTKADAAQADLVYLLSTLAKNPAYLRVSGKPVVFLYAGTSQALTPEQWTTVTVRAAAQVPPGVQLIGSGQSPADVLLWDGFYTLNTTRSMAGASLADCAQIQRETFRPLIALARKTGGISVEAVLPGYDDRRANDGTGRMEGTVADRLGGQLYSTLWDQAIQDGPDWVLVNSFNQWHNGTEVEPSVEMGDRYLALTRQFAIRFKGRSTLNSQARDPQVAKP